MKKLIALLLLFAVAVSAEAQREVTKFLGIPVDGTKSEMIRKIKAKGFRSSTLDKDVLQGKFNGQDVYLSVVTNGTKVYRVYLQDENTMGERDIQIRFNLLCSQFESNPKYEPHRENKRIPDDEDISYEMGVNSKRYEATFYQKGEGSENKVVWFMISKGFLPGTYTISMFYDNLCNQANGEDL